MLTRSFRLSSILSLLLAAMAPLGHAADPVVYSQPATPSNYYTIWASCISPSGAAATGYDNFTLSSATSISAVQWNGDYLNTNDPGANPIAPNSKSFTITFLADNGGLPGATLATTTIAQADCAPALLGTDGFTTSSSIPAYQIPFYSFRAVLPTPFVASAGQQYWVSIVANLTDENGWGWFSGSGGDDASIQYYQGTQSRSMDRAFALEGAAAAATAPTVGVAVSMKTADANAGTPGVFTLTLSAPATAKLKVKYSLGGTAVNGTDYAALSGKAVFNPGQSSVDVQVVPTTPPVGVSYDAFKKTVLLTLQPGKYTVGTTKPAKVKIVRSAGIILP